MKTILLMRAINEHLRENPQPGLRRITLKTARRLQQDMESRSQGIPETWEKIKAYVAENWIDILRLLITVVTLLAEEKDD